MRRIPFEVMVKGDKVPFYEETLEDAGRFTDQPVLPFNAYGTMALARQEFEANSGSSQVFWLLKVESLVIFTLLQACSPRLASCTDTGKACAYYWSSLCRHAGVRANTIWCKPAGWAVRRLWLCCRGPGLADTASGVLFPAP